MDVSYGLVGHGTVPKQDPLRPRRILLVDDNTHSVECLAQIIRFWGHEARVALDGSGALASAQEFQPDLVLLDIGLPDMDGFTVAHALRDAPWFGRASLMALTGYGPDDHPDDGRRRLFDRFLTKPLDFDDLHALLSGLPDPPPSVVEPTAP